MPDPIDDPTVTTEPAAPPPEGEPPDPGAQAVPLGPLATMRAAQAAFTDKHHAVKLARLAVAGADADVKVAAAALAAAQAKLAQLQAAADAAAHDQDVAKQALDDAIDAYAASNEDAEDDETNPGDGTAAPAAAPPQGSPPDKG